MSNRVLGLLLLGVFMDMPSTRAAGAPPATTSSLSYVQTLHAAINQGDLAGAVTVIADIHGIIETDVAGYSDVKRGIAMQPDNLFWVASMTKPVTAAAFMMLVDEGKVSLDDPVENYLPEFRNVKVQTPGGGSRPPSRKIVIRDLLCHISGMPFLSPGESNGPIELHSLKDCAQEYAGIPLPLDPGQQYVYSNEGFTTAARIMEVVSGIPYQQFLQERIFNPLGMINTTFWPDDRQVQKLAKSYAPNADNTALKEIPIHFLHYPLQDRTRRFPSPGGGLFSTAEDFSKFARLLLGRGVFEAKRYLSEAAIDQMTRDQTGVLKANYGLGLALGPDSFGHGGAYKTTMSIYPHKGLIAIFLVQQAGCLPGNRNIDEHLLPALWQKVESMPDAAMR